MQKKVKSMQMFRKPVVKASQVGLISCDILLRLFEFINSLKGDRVGICVTQFDSKLLERGLVCVPGVVLSATGNYSMALAFHT